MLDVMHYMTRYPDVLHHPKEDLIFARIKERAGRPVPTIDELAQQHASLRESGRELARDLEDVVNGSISSREHVEAVARAYVTRLRNHMRVEETEILPLAARLLRADDWDAVERRSGTSTTRCSAGKDGRALCRASTTDRDWGTASGLTADDALAAFLCRAATSLRGRSSRIEHVGDRASQLRIGQIGHSATAGIPPWPLIAERTTVSKPG